MVPSRFHRILAKARETVFPHSGKWWRLALLVDYTLKFGMHFSFPPGDTQRGAQSRPRKTVAKVTWWDSLGFHAWLWISINVDKFFIQLRRTVTADLTRWRGHRFEYVRRSLILKLTWHRPVIFSLLKHPSATPAILQILRDCFSFQPGRCVNAYVMK